MRNAKKIFAHSFIAMLSATALAVPAAHAGSGIDVSASAAVANMYLWRGYDLGVKTETDPVTGAVVSEDKGTPAISGELKATHGSGVYAGIWGSSGDASLGSEYDLYAGWGGKVGKVNVDASVWSYVYPESDISVGDAVDAVVSAGVGPVKATLYETLEGDDSGDYRYGTVSYTKGKYSAMYGQHSKEGGADPGHIQLGYQYNDNLSFAVSKFVVDTDTVEEDPQFLVSYSIPLKK